MSPFDPGFAPPERSTWARRTKRWLPLSWNEIAAPLDMSPASVANMVHPQRMRPWLLHYLSALAMGWRPSPWCRNASQAEIHARFRQLVPEQTFQLELAAVLGVDMDHWFSYWHGSASHWPVRVAVMLEAVSHLVAPSPLPFDSWAL